MSVRIEGERHIDAPREQVYAALTDPKVVADTVPFVERYEARSERSWLLVVKPPVPLAPSIPLEFELVESRPPEHARLRASGSKLGAGADVDSTFDLSESSGGTFLRFRAEITLTGRLAPVERLLEPLAQRQAKRTLDSIETKALEGPKKDQP